MATTLAQYSQLKRDLLNDGISEGKLKAYENLTTSLDRQANAIEYYNSGISINLNTYIRSMVVMEVKAYDLMADYLSASDMLGLYSDPRLMKGIDIKAYPFICYTDNNSKTTFVVNKKVLTMPFDVYLSGYGMSVFSDTINIIPLNDDGTPEETITIVKTEDSSTSDVSLTNYESEVNGEYVYTLVYNVGTYTDKITL